MHPYQEQAQCYGRRTCGERYNDGKLVEVQRRVIGQRNLGDCQFEVSYENHFHATNLCASCKPALHKCLLF